MYGITLNSNIRIARIWTNHALDWLNDSWYTSSSGTLNDLIFGGNESNAIFGAGGNDMIWAGGGDDWVVGGDGNDYVDGGNGQDWLEGSSGNDRVFGGNGHDILFGDSSGRYDYYEPIIEGNDALYGGNGDDVIYGQGGNDLLDGGTGSDQLDGGEGSDRLIGGSGDDYMSGGNGADVFQYGFATDNRSKYLDMGALWGHDYIPDFDPSTGDRYDFTAFFSRFSDADVDTMIRVWGSGDRYFAFGMPMTGEEMPTYQLTSLGGGQQFTFWVGIDPIGDLPRLHIQNMNFGTAATIRTEYPWQGFMGDRIMDYTNIVTSLGTSKAIHLTSGNDTIDFSNLQTWTDFTHSDPGKSAQIYAFEGDDTVKGTANNDSIYGGIGDDVLSGYKGNDTLYGENGNDQLVGDQGNDTLSGGKGDDTLYGGAGRDVLNGDAGNDWMTGGADADRFVFGGTLKVDLLHPGIAPTMDFSANGSDIIMDFNRSEGDKIQFTNVNSLIGMNQTFVSDWLRDFATTNADANGDRVNDTIIFNDLANTQAILTAYGVSLTSGDFLFA